MMIKRLLLFLVMLAAIPLLSTAQVIPATERQALQNLYDATYGAGWSNSTNWYTAADESTWFGVTVTSGHVTSIALPDNNLDGTLPVSITQLTFLTNLDLSGNNIQALPNQLGGMASLVSADLSSNLLSFVPDFTGVAMTTLHVENNKLLFDQIEQNIGLALYTYSPQANLPGGSYTFGAGTYGPVIMGAITSGDYQWYRNGQAIPGENGNAISFYPFEFNDAGTYHYQSTKATVPGLTLRTDPFIVTAQSCVSSAERNALVALYMSTHGEAWINNTNWLTTAPVEQWFGIQVSDCHVSTLYLDGNNLDGTLPAELSDLEYLTSLSLQGNQLHGTIPIEFEDLTQLQVISLHGNILEGSIPPGIGSLPLLSFVNFGQNNLEEIPAFTSPFIVGLQFYLNKMTFEDIAVNASVAGLDYYPLLPLPSQYMAAAPATPVTFQASDTESNNSYAWYKNGVLIAGETSSSYTIPSVSSADETVYWVEISNSVFTSQTFTETFILTVSDGSTIPLSERAALIEFFHSTGGYSWTDQTGWLSADESTWAGVTVTSGHVTSLVRSNNNVGGALQESLGNLTFLQTLDLSANFISGAVPTSLTAITSLTQINLLVNQLSSLPQFTSSSITQLDVRNNRFDFDDLLANVSVVGFAYEFQSPHTLPSYNVHVTEGNPVKLRGIEYPFAGYQYQWVLETTPIGSANLPSYEIAAAAPGDMGQYTLEISHTSLPGLTIAGYFDYLAVDPMVSCIPQSEYEALLQLFQSMGGSTWIRGDYWLNDDPTMWYGVTIDACHVTELNLPGNGLSGSLPSAFGDLPFLTRLDLHGNQLSGSLPDELGDLTVLEYLDLSFNAFDNDAPSSIGTLAALETVRLQSNHLTGIPVFSASTLTSLDISSNELDFGDLEPLMSTPGLVYLPQTVLIQPFNQSATIGSPVGLLFSPDGTANVYQWYKGGAALAGETTSSFVISSFQLTDEGPYTAKVTNALVPGLTLTSEFMVVKGGGCVPSEDRAALLWLYYTTKGRLWNNKTGWLSADESTWYGVTLDDCEVESINLDNNNLNGSLPTQIGDLASLTSLSVYNGSLGSLPPSLGNLTSLRVLNLESVNLGGNIPPELGNLSNLEVLNLSYNRLTGTIPPELGNLNALQTLNLYGQTWFDGSAGFQGNIPAELGSLSNLRTLSLGYNQLRGSIPAELGDIPAANELYLNLGTNQLTGTIPVQLRSAHTLELSFNYLTGELPANLGTGALSSLEAYGNALSGPLPSNIGDWDQLVALNLGFNQVSGNIPNSIGDMQNLHNLYLGNNQLSGLIPATIGDLANAIIIEINNNQLTGPIPPSISNLSSLWGLNLTSNQLSGAIPAVLGNLTQLQYLQLSQNQLDGPIPATLGNLSGLFNLMLDGNDLTGTIPPELGNIPLQVLYLGDNLLTGTIPPELADNGDLRNLRLEYNQLTGPIPTELGGLTLLTNFVAGNNDLTGDIPPGFGSMAILSIFQIENNQITSVPALGSAITSLKVEGNLLDFEDLELNVGKAGYTYSPQNTVLSGGTVTPNLGCTLTIPFTTPGSQNTYQWAFSGIDIAGAVAAQYSKLNAEPTDNGIYNVAVSNTLLPGLTLPSADWTVTVGGTQLGSPSVTDGSGCVGTSVTLAASGAIGPEVYRWFDVASGGVSLETAATFNTPVLPDTTEYWVQRFDPVGVCESLRQKVIGYVVTPITPGATGGAHCGPGTVVLNATGGIAGEYRWYTGPSGGTAIASETTATYTTPSIPSTASYYVSVVKAGCEGSRTTVTAAINDIPSTPGTTNTVSCTSPATVSLTATGAAAGEYRWYIDASTPAPISGEVNDTYVTPSISLTTTYYVAVNDGLCESSRMPIDAVITTLSAPGGTGSSSCDPASLTLNATGGSPGEYKWYTVPTGGTAIVGETNGSLVTPSLSTTTSYYVVIADAVCESPRTQLDATIVNLGAPAAIGDTFCAPGTAVLVASGGAAGEYRWYTVASGGTAISGEVNASFTTPSLPSDATYYVALNDGTCESPRQTVDALAHITSAPTTTDGAACEGSAVSLTASGGVAGEYRWYTVPVAGTAISGEVNGSYVTPSLTTTTPYYVSINDGTCESTRETVVATVDLLPGSPSATDGSHCGPGVVSLSASGGANGDYRWYTVGTGGTAISAEVNDTFISPILASTTSYFVAVNDGTCESIREEAIAAIVSVPITPSATDGALCGPGAVSLSATGGANGDYRWYTVATGGTPLTGEVADTYTTPVLASTTSYFVAINNGSCESTREEVVAGILTVPTQPLATDGSLCGPGSISLTASGGANGDYRWYTTLSGGTAIAGEVNDAFATPVLSSTTSYFVAIANAACESTREEVVAAILPVPSQPVATDGSNCGPGVVSLSASGGVNGDYRWYSVSTGGTAIAGEVNNTFSTPSIASTTSYFVAVANASCESIREEAVATIQSLPSTPNPTDGFNCGSGAVTISASGGLDGDYRWYTVATGGTAIPGETNSEYKTPSLTSTTTYFVALASASCEGSRAPVVAEIRACTQAPEIGESESTVTVEGIVTVDLGPLISDPDNDVDLSSLTIVVQPVSGAIATILGSDLEIDYAGVVFSGVDSLQVRVCDLSGLCTSQWLYVQVVGETVVFNAISPNGDNKNDVFLIEYVDFLPETRRNHVSILNRWGDEVWEGTNYDNQTVVFQGLNKNGNELPSGTYFYKVVFEGNRPPLSGYLSLKR